MSYKEMMSLFETMFITPDEDEFCLCDAMHDKGIKVVLSFNRENGWSITITK